MGVGVSYYGCWDLEPTDKLLPIKLFDSLGDDCCYMFCFDPYGELINCHYQELDLSWDGWKRTKDIYSHTVNVQEGITNYRLVEELLGFRSDANTCYISSCILWSTS